jgi:hypothetical protein
MFPVSENLQRGAHHFYQNRPNGRKIGVKYRYDADKTLDTCTFGCR